MHTWYITHVKEKKCDRYSSITHTMHAFTAAIYDMIQNLQINK